MEKQTMSQLFRQQFITAADTADAADAVDAADAAAFMRQVTMTQGINVRDI